MVDRDPGDETTEEESSIIAWLRQDVATWARAAATSDGVYRERAVRVLACARRLLAEELADPRAPDDRAPRNGPYVTRPG